MTALLDLLDRHPLFTGWTGATFGLGASLVQTLEHIDLFLRVGGGAVGLMVALLTLPMTLDNFSAWVRRKRKL